MPAVRGQDFMRAALIVAVTASAACESALDENTFQRRAEKVFAEVNPGFGIMRRKGPRSTFVRGDQVYTLDT